MKTIKNAPKKIKSPVLLVVILCLLTAVNAKSQLIAVKQWKGQYPEMGGNYPQFFLAFKDASPHAFVKAWPTHYYWDVVSTPSTDAGEIDGGLKTGMKRVLYRTFERTQVEGRHKETGGIKINTNAQMEIAKELFATRFDRLDDDYKLVEGFIKLYEKIGQFDKGPKANGIKQIFEKEADGLMSRFLMANMLKTDHGDKLETFSEIHAEQSKLMGEVDYTFQKARFFNSFGSTIANSSYNFLTE